MKKNRVKLKIKGLNQERILNLISKTINIYNIKRENHNISEIEVDYKKKKKVVSILQCSGLEILEINTQGLIFKVKRFFKSYGIIAGILVCLCSYIIQYNFILKIDVRGVDQLNKQEVVRYIENNIHSRFKNKINSDRLEQNLIENFKEISSASVAIVGQTLLVNINESILPDEMQTGNSPIISEFNGLITDINLVQGTLAVNVGDIVKKGDILVYPYIIDSEGEKREVFPKAEVWADIWLNGQEIFYEYRLATKRTEEKIVLNEIYLFNLLIYSNNKVCEFEEFEKVEESCYLSKNNLMPFIIKKTTYYKLVTKEIIEEFDLVKEDIFKKARQKALIFLLENEIIKEEKFTIREGGGIYQVNCLVTVNRNIGG